MPTQNMVKLPETYFETAGNAHTHFSKLEPI